jgi:hypothetical protein
LTTPLTQLSKKDSPFLWSKNCSEAFKKLKAEFLKAPVLQHFNPSLPITVTTDGSDFTISGIIQQLDANGDLHPVAFFSQKLTPAKINYDIHDKELLGIIETFCKN